MGGSSYRGNAQHEAYAFARRGSKATERLDSEENLILDKIYVSRAVELHTSTSEMPRPDQWTGGPRHRC